MSVSILNNLMRKRVSKKDKGEFNQWTEINSHQLPTVNIYLVTQ